MSKTEAAERIMEIAEEIRELVQEAMDLVREEGSDVARNRARSYWYAHILTSLGGDHGFMGGSMCSMEDTARELEDSYDEDDEEEVDEEEDMGTLEGEAETPT
jgi:hypothetical protein